MRHFVATVVIIVGCMLMATMLIFGGFNVAENQQERTKAMVERMYAKKAQKD